MLHALHQYYTLEPEQMTTIHIFNTFNFKSLLFMSISAMHPIHDDQGLDNNVRSQEDIMSSYPSTLLVCPILINVIVSLLLLLLSLLLLLLLLLMMMVI